MLEVSVFLMYVIEECVLYGIITIQLWMVGCKRPYIYIHYSPNRIPDPHKAVIINELEKWRWFKANYMNIRLVRVICMGAMDKNEIWLLSELNIFVVVIIVKVFRLIIRRISGILTPSSQTPSISGPEQGEMTLSLPIVPTNDTFSANSANSSDYI